MLSGRATTLCQALTFAWLLLWCDAAIDLAHHSGPNLDELAHLAAGLRGWQTGAWDAYLVNPPTARVACSLPAYLSTKSSADWIPNDKAEWDQPCYRPEFDLGDRFRDAVGTVACHQRLVAGRLVTLGISVLGTLLLWCWTSRQINPLAGCFTTLVWLTSPTALNYCVTINPDAWAAFGGLVAVATMNYWMKRPTVEGAVVVGLGLSVAILTKYTWIGLPAVWLIVVGLLWWRGRWRCRFGAMMLHGGLMVVVPLACLNAVFGFAGTGCSIGSLAFCSDSLKHWRDLLPGLPSPLPTDMVRGIDLQRRDFEVGDWSYLLGQWSRRGWWYWYPVAFTVKEPLAWVLTVVAGLTVWNIRWITHRLNRWQSERSKAFVGQRAGQASRTAIASGLAITAAVYIIVLLASQNGFTKYYRYFLPAYLLLCIPLGGWMARLCDRSGWRLVVGGLILWAMTACYSARREPYAYFNESVGGPSGGHRVLLGSSLAWGEDSWRLLAWLERHRATRPLWVYRETTTYPLPISTFSFANEPADFNDPPPGTYVIAVNRLLQRDSTLAPFRSRTPFETIGSTYRVYRICESIQGN